MAARVGAGVQAWELRIQASKHNITVLSPGGSTVGVAGGWIAAGGHGPLTSKLGLGSDQLLSFNVVTADGQLVTADPETNRDLWWAIRGGGPGNYGVVTSVVMKAFPIIRSTSFSVEFSANPHLNATQPPSFRGPYRGGPPFPNATVTMPAPFPNATGTASSRSGTTPPRQSPNVVLNNATLFWEGVKLTYQYCTHIQAFGGYCYSYINPLANSSFRFTHSFSIPDLSRDNATSLMAPLFTTLNQIGINLPLPANTPPNITRPTALSPPFPTSTSTPSSPPQNFQAAATLSSTRYRSRLIPQAFFTNTTLYSALFSAIISGVSQGNYTFHGIAYTPTTTIAGPLGVDSSVNPAWRRAALHASFMDTVPPSLTPAEAKLSDSRGHRYADALSLKEIEGVGTLGTGSYLNEGDPMEPEWQESFYGMEKYGRLLRIKRVRDPWGVFWTRTAPGSEEWEVKSLDGYPGSSNGRLCRVGRV